MLDEAEFKRMTLMLNRPESEHSSCYLLLLLCECLGLGCYNNTVWMGRFRNRHLFLTVPESGRSKIRVPAQLGSGESTPPGLQMAAFLLCPHMAESRVSCLFLFL